MIMTQDIRDDQEADRIMVDLLAPVTCIKAPADLHHRILAACRIEADRRSRRGPFLRGATLGLAAMLAVLIFHFPSHREQVSPGIPARQATFTPREVRAARRDLAWTLTVTGRVLDLTGKQVVGDIFGRKLPEALTTSLHQALNKPLKGRS